MPHAATAATTPGCGQAAPIAPVGAGPNLLALDQRSRTLYVVNSCSNTVSAVAVAHCSARDTSGCARTSPTFQVGTGPFGIALDPGTADAVRHRQHRQRPVRFDAAACNAANTSGCRDEAPTVATGGARDLAVAPAFHTLYVTQPGSDSVALIDTRRCNAAHLWGCDAPSASVAPAPLPVGIVFDRGHPHALRQQHG